MLRYFGVEGYRALVDTTSPWRAIGAVRAQPELELLARGLSIVSFRYVPAGYRARPAVADPDLDALNRRLLTAVQVGGRSFLSGAVVDGAVARRACFVNPGTREEAVDALVAEVRRGRRVA